MTAQVLQPLHSSLDTLEASLPTGDHAQSERLMGEHLQAVAALSLVVERPTDDAIRALIARQQQVMGRMLQLRDEAAARLNQGKRSLRAAHAYLKAESLA
ncbi:hypothetical protein [Stenotrophomonas tumulicola]|uniref:Flagellar protein FliT n=1 Tax=Stenotrophomonas tumulicola TaxID=1685415 RepID=A0A7W3IGR6_9GAMM|nr:hypothetical protein [Stenotrophomonas tumulicola]MBA8681215.1 hypothetical protein [Stenotrophomonas tumulicola]